VLVRRELLKMNADYYGHYIPAHVRELLRLPKNGRDSFDYVMAKDGMIVCGLCGAEYDGPACPFSVAAWHDPDAEPVSVLAEDEE